MNIYIYIYIHIQKINWWANNEATMWLSFVIYIYVYVFMIIIMSWIFYFTMVLHSTTGPYGRLMLEVAYGEILLSLHRDCMGDDSSGRVVGVSAWCIAHVWHTRVNTSVGSMYIIFGFLNTKTYVYVYWFQNLYVV